MAKEPQSEIDQRTKRLGSQQQVSGIFDKRLKPTITRNYLWVLEVTGAHKAELKKMSPEALIEGFVTEAKLSDPTMPSTVPEMNEHGTWSRAFASEIIARGGAKSLVPLLDSPDNWIANCTARVLARVEDTKDRAMATLDRIADERSGDASFSADTARNMIRYGDPGGDPVEVEKRLAKIRARDGAR